MGYGSHDCHSPDPDAQSHGPAERRQGRNEYPGTGVLLYGRCQFHFCRRQLLTTPNPSFEEDNAMFSLLGLDAMEAFKNLKLKDQGYKSGC